MYQPTLLLVLFMLSTIGIFAFFIEFFTQKHLKKETHGLRKIFIATINNNPCHEHSYTFKPMFSKTPKELLKECRENDLKPAPVEEVNMFMSSYLIINQEHTANYYKEYNCWGIELEEGVVTLLMKKC